MFFHVHCSVWNLSFFADIIFCSFPEIAALSLMPPNNYFFYINNQFRSHQKTWGFCQTTLSTVNMEIKQTTAGTVSLCVSWLYSTVMAFDIIRQIYFFVIKSNVSIVRLAFTVLEKTVLILFTYRTRMKTKMTLHLLIKFLK